jgi:hypothetical protein
LRISGSRKTSFSAWTAEAFTAVRGVEKLGYTSEGDYQEDDDDTPKRCGACDIVVGSHPVLHTSFAGKGPLRHKDAQRQSAKDESLSQQVYSFGYWRAIFYNLHMVWMDIHPSIHTLDICE